MNHSRIHQQMAVVMVAAATSAATATDLETGGFGSLLLLS